MTDVVLLDYGAGNLRSLRAAFERAGARAAVTQRPGPLAGADLVVIPGVGAAGPAMSQLEAQALTTAIHEAIAAGSAILGVCLGLQLLFEHSEEGDVACLGVLRGQVTELRGARRLPHMGWNDVEPVRSDHPLAAALPAVCYFAHTYAVQDASPEVVVATTTVERGSFASVVAQERIIGAQFHPERSGEAGRALLRAALAAAEGRPQHAA